MNRLDDDPETVLVVRDLHVRVSGRILLEGVDLEVRRGEVVALVGPNGSGKSTLLKALMGEIPFEGRVEIHGRTGYVPQRLDFDPASCVTVMELFAASLSRRPVWMGISRETRRRVRAALALAGAEGLERFRFGRLSGGERQRVLLALALEPLPDLLLLDEPEAGIDLAGTGLFHHVVGNLCRHCRMGVVVATHSEETVAKLAHRSFRLDKGRVVAEAS